VLLCRAANIKGKRSEGFVWCFLHSKGSKSGWESHRDWEGSHQTLQDEEDTACLRVRASLHFLNAPLPEWSFNKLPQKKLPGSLHILLSSESSPSSPCGLQTYRDGTPATPPTSSPLLLSPKHHDATAELFAVACSHHRVFAHTIPSPGECLDFTWSVHPLDFKLDVTCSGKPFLAFEPRLGPPLHSHSLQLLSGLEFHFPRP
jgi:hypothetical protein